MDLPEGVTFSKGLVYMLMAIQFPIADSRPFSSLCDFRLPLPDFPEPLTDINPQFVHHFGEAQERIDDPDKAWPDEIKYINASRAIKFDHLENHYCGLPNRKLNPQCTYRRLFNDGWAVVRTEIGFKFKNGLVKSQKLTLEDVFSITQDVCELPTTTYNLKKKISKLPLIQQGRNLSKSYGLASMMKEGVNDAKGLDLIEEGKPLAIIELNENETSIVFASNPKIGLVLVDRKSVNGANVLFCRIKTKVGYVSTWILQKGMATDEQLRSLRICLTRVHAEREVLDSILRQIHRKRLIVHPSEDSVDRLDEYFNKRIRILDKKTWFGINQTEILAAIEASQKVIRDASTEQLISRYVGGRRQVWNKVDNYQKQRQAVCLSQVVNIEKGAIVVDKNVTVSGNGNIVNVADYLSNVTNTVNNAMEETTANDEIKQLVMELSKEVTKISMEAEDKHTKNLGKNLEALSNELTNDEPDSRWYELSLSGLKDAAQAIGSIANPIIDIVKKLTPLLV